ncbi:MAG: hypothetical protein AMXMBFR4_13990 [Candidatus Hydrogenedentota bacterium]
MKTQLKTILAATVIATVAGCGGQPDSSSASPGDQAKAVPPALRPEPESARSTTAPAEDAASPAVDPATLPYSQRKRLREESAQPKTLSAAAAVYTPEVPLIANSGFEEWVGEVPVGFLASNYGKSAEGRGGSTALALNAASGASKPGVLKFPIDPPQGLESAMLIARAWGRASAERLLTLDIAYFTTDGKFHSKASVHPGDNRWHVLEVAEPLRSDIKKGSLTVRVLRSEGIGGDAVVDDIQAEIRTHLKSFYSTTFDSWTNTTPTGWGLTDAKAMPARKNTDRISGAVLVPAADASKTAVLKRGLGVDRCADGDFAAAAVWGRASEPGLLGIQLAYLTKNGEFKAERAWHPGDGESHMVWLTLPLNEEVNPETLNLQIYRAAGKKGEVILDSVEAYVTERTAYVYSTEFDHWVNGLPAGWSIKPNATSVAPVAGEAENSIALDLKRADDDAESTSATLHIQAGPEVIGGKLEAVVRAKADLADVLVVQLAYFQKDGKFVHARRLVPGNAKWTSVPLTLDIPKAADPSRLSVSVFRKAGSDEGSSVDSVRARILLP